MFGMIRVGITVVFALLVTATAWAGNWNQGNSSSTNLTVDVWKKNNVPIAVKNNLQKAGLNSIADWSGCSSVRSAGNTDQTIDNAFRDGWSHFVFIVCIDKMFPTPEHRLNLEIATAKIDALEAQITRMSKKHPDRLFVISLKSREVIGGWAKKGIRTTYVYDAYEKKISVREDYIKLWEMIAQKTAHIPQTQLAFNLMNEPEFHNVAVNRTNTWGKYANELIGEIREISPQRTIIVEGVFKSNLGRQQSASDMMPVVNHDNIVYGFHHYQPYDFTHWKKAGGKKFTSEIKRKVQTSLRGMISFSKSNKVPVILSEVGVWGPYPTNGKPISGISFQDRAAFMRVVKEETLDKGIGLTWWALFDLNTPYKRLSEGKLQSSMEKDDLLWEVLQLNTK